MNMNDSDITERRERLKRTPDYEMKKEQSVRLSEQLPWYVSTVGDRPESYCFYSSRTAIVCYGFVALSLMFRDVRWLNGAFVAFLIKGFHVVAKWVDFIAANDKLQEATEITRRYFNLLKSHVGAFVDEEANHRTVRKMTAAVVLYQRNLQFFVLGKFLKRRNNQMKRNLANAMDHSSSRFSSIASDQSNS